jgi:hypothetical protein
VKCIPRHSVARRTHIKHPDLQNLSKLYPFLRHLFWNPPASPTHNHGSAHSEFPARRRWKPGKLGRRQPMQQILAPRRHYASHPAYRIKPSFSGGFGFSASARVLARVPGCTGRQRGAQRTQRQPESTAAKGSASAGSRIRVPKLTTSARCDDASRCFIPQVLRKLRRYGSAVESSLFVVVKKLLQDFDKPCFASSSSRYGRIIYGSSKISGNSEQGARILDCCMYKLRIDAISV